MGESVMVSENMNEGRILWLKSLLNSFLVWILGFIVFMIPGLIVSMKMGFELGPKTRNPEVVSSQISSAISEMYSSSTLLMGFYAGLFCVLIFWRARAAAKGTGDKKIMNGLMVSAVPVLTSLFFAFSGGIDIYSVIEIIVFLAAGAAGGYSIKKAIPGLPETPV